MRSCTLRGAHTQNTHSMPAGDKAAEKDGGDKKAEKAKAESKKIPVVVTPPTPRDGAYISCMQPRVVDSQEGGFLPSWRFC